ncbi:MAG: nucleoside hydrolase [Anaerolineae bacterium]|nr:nucleoside hydrolase [Anaerolineae bacterium]
MNRHLDTDLGGDMDDLCALAMLLRWPGDVQLTGITTVGDIGGERAGCVCYVLGLEGLDDVPVAAGVDGTDACFRYELGVPPQERYWPVPIPPAASAPDEAVQLLKRSIEQGATIIAIGPYSNLYLLETQHPGILMQADLYLMGGYVYPTRPGFPNWGNDFDFNIQVDVRSAQYVIAHSNPTLVPLSVTVETFIRRAYLERLSGAGALGRLIASQAEVFAADENIEEKHGKTCSGLPEDVINFQHDSLACAVALGWNDCVEIEEIPLSLEIRHGWLHEVIDPDGKPTRVVTAIDGGRFSKFWLDVVAGAADA